MDRVSKEATEAHQPVAVVTEHRLPRLTEVPLPQPDTEPLEDTERHPRTR